MKKKLSFVLLIIGVIVLILGFIEYNKYITEQNSYGLVESEVSAVTINNGRTIVNFEFQLNGKYYFSDIFTEETFEIGDKQKIYYLKRDPSICKISLITVYKAVIIFVIGSIILLIGFIILIKYLLYVMRIKNLKKKGLLIKATIQEVLVINKNRGKNPYKIRACYVNPRDNKIYYYLSEEEKEDLKDLVSKYNIKTIDVYLNAKNTDDYYVDIESIKR